MEKKGNKSSLRYKKTEAAGFVIRRFFAIFADYLRRM